MDENASSWKVEEAPPEAASLMESLRAFSYSMSTAIADIVDNSITARARTISITFKIDPDEGAAVFISDDGCGITEAELGRIMRLGSRNPLEAREAHDLGRFGLGLKTASLSQCRCLTVLSKVAGKPPFAATWDLDHIQKVNSWQLIRDVPPHAGVEYSKLKGQSHGTVVIWKNIDRVGKGRKIKDVEDQRAFLDAADQVKEHLSMVFHRLLEDGDFKLLINGRALSPWNPFLRENPATQKFPEEHLPGGVTLAAFVLPHVSKLSKIEHQETAGPLGWNAHQGFYVYRQKRLLVPGDWLSFGWSKEEHYKLARIQVDITNDCDREWKVDVTKSQATPPLRLRQSIRKLAERVRSQAKKVYTFRGALLKPSAERERAFLWHQMARNNQTIYRIDRKHPLVERALKSAGDKAAFNALLKLIEGTIPTPLITIHNSEQPDTIPKPLDGYSEKQVLEIARQMYGVLRDLCGNHEEACHLLAKQWPFELYPAEIQLIREELQDA